MFDHDLKQEFRRYAGSSAGWRDRKNLQFDKIMTSLANLTLAVTNLTTAVALIGPQQPVTGTDPGATAAQVNAAAAAIAAQTAILTADVAPASNVIPLAPASFTAVSAGSGNVTLSFTPSAGATSYNVKRSTAAGTEANVASVPAPAATTPTTPVTFSDSGLTTGVYYYEVTAVNAAGESPVSLEVTVTV
jgi:hypothetical protein